ncbi:MAG: hypothetical protein VX949_10825 [Planctomycetota bacterium]|nr:hypothetical protein [Planctomycetota bacterium]
MRSVLPLLLIATSLLITTCLQANPLQSEEYATGTVGIEGQILLKWAGKPLEVAPIPDDSPVLVRIASITPAAEGEGQDSTYDLRWIAMLPGEHDLAPLLRHGEGDAAIQLPTMIISVSSLLKDDHDGDLNQIPGPISPILGFPEWVPWALAIGWMLLPLSILTLIRWLRKAPAPEPVPAPPPTLAELLRPLVIAALAGELDDARKATMERILLAHWRVELDLGSYRHGEGIQKLRAHPEAGILLVTVEQWLHSGRDEAVSEKQLEDLLAPYATPIPDAIEEGS